MYFIAAGDLAVILYDGFSLVIGSISHHLKVQSFIHS